MSSSSRCARDDRPLRRRASVLVLVVTLLSILFVMGVAFLATMNFEAERLASERKQDRTELGAELLIDDAGAFLRAGLMSGADQPFAGDDPGGSLTGFAQLPGWHNASSPIEPYLQSSGRVVWPWFVDARSVADTQQICIEDPGGVPAFPGATCSSSTECQSGRCRDVYTCRGGANSGAVCHPDYDCPGGFCDTSSGVCRGGPNSRPPPRSCSPDLSCPAGTCLRARFGGPRWRGAEMDTTWRPGTVHTLAVCESGPRAGASCRFDADCGTGSDRCVAIRSVCVGGARDRETCVAAKNCPGGTCTGEPVVVVDADGDGVVDAVQVRAEELGFSREQIEQISTVVNASSNTSGDVFVGLRIVPHGGMVNLNDAHPLLIETALNINSVFDEPVPSLGIPRIRPAIEQVFYTPQQEEPALRRRGIFPSRIMSPTRLQGDPLLSEDLRADKPFGGADMPLQLFPPKQGRSFESVYEGEHRYWPVRPLEPLYATDLNSPAYWLARMEPFISFGFDGSESEYDRRHLVTTVSHDALLARGGRVVINNEPRDMRDLMMEVNGDFDSSDCSVVPFEFPDYPHNIANNVKPNTEDAVCACPDLKVCSFDPRKGRLQLSLGWMDEAVDQWFDGIDGGLNPRQRKRLIYDVFFMMVNNAAGPEWDDVVCTVPGDCDVLTERCSGDPNKPGLCVDRVLNLPRHQTRATRTAASLTANLLDYMDDRVCVGGDLDGWSCSKDRDCGGGAAFCGPPDAPTRVAVRNLDFGGGVCLGPGTTYKGEYCRTSDDCADPITYTRSGTCSTEPGQQIKSCSGGTRDGQSCTKHAQCGPGGSCVSTVGREINIDANPSFARRYEYVYGLERQPFITEVATVTNTKPPGLLVGRSVEIFNPNDAPLGGGTTFEIVEVDANQVERNRLALNEIVPPDAFRALTMPITAFALPPGTLGVVDLTGTRQLQFENGWTVYLVRRTEYADPPGAKKFKVVDVDVVLDAFPITGANLGQAILGTPPPPPAPVTGTFTTTVQRPVTNKALRWTAPIAAPDAEVTGGAGPGTIPPDPQTLGTWNNYSKISTIHPVEMRFANTGSFTRPAPGLPSGDPNERTVAFPTTGSLLMIMRHANHSLDDLTMPSHSGVASNPVRLRDRLAFTAWLNDATVVKQANGSVLATIEAREQIDNGRMPVFDLGVTVGGRQYAAHHRPAWQSAAGRPGGVGNMPWGQLVFDYFTALPLRNRGPYRPDPLNLNAPVGLPGSRPRVDLRGLRVHGRIDLNAAPWTVLAGLPYVPLEEFSTAYRDRLRVLLFDGTAGPEVDGVAQGVGDALAQAVVAYRESREGVPAPNPTTGDYAQLGFGRSYLDANPAFRRGTGFLSVGELANVRHAFAARANLNLKRTIPGGRASFYRIDNGRVVSNRIDLDDDGNAGPAYNANQDDYVQAIGLLATLGDWVTVRSDVFTIYGVVRGEIDPSVAESVQDPDGAETLVIDDVDARALRFQETVDRLPTFLGGRTPSRVGDRTLASFKDVQDD